MKLLGLEKFLKPYLLQIMQKHNLHYNIYLNYNTKTQRVITSSTESEIKKYLKEGHFGIGSMEPKIKSALYFLKHHGEKVVITSIDKIEKAILGQAGTHIIKDS